MTEGNIPAPFDPKYIDFIRRILSVAETGVPVWNPSASYVYNDGRNGRKQCTLSIGFTADGGNLRKVLEQYVKLGGVYGPRFAATIALLKAGSAGTGSAFRNLLAEAGQEDPLMMSAQTQMFDMLYLGPAFQWASQHGFARQLSYLVIADSFLHSGSMLDSLMNRFAERKPSVGGNEQVWIHDYADVRRKWLATHSRKILHNTVYRCDCYLTEIKRDNWNLAQAPVIMNGTKVDYGTETEIS